jgi:formate dehydrogenase maturation protein FdhE
MNLSKYDLRITRADHLAEQHPFAGEALAFFTQVTRLQAELYSDIERARGELVSDTLSALRRGELPDRAIQRFPKFLSRLEELSPEPLLRSAEHLNRQDPSYWRPLFISCWQSTRTNGDQSEMALGRMFLQPFAEFLAEQVETHSPAQVPATCPFCFEKPLAGVLRPEGDGGKRSLLCSMCATEWHCGRILCPACGEQNVEKLAVYSTDQFPQVRIEACDSCRFYIKTIDLTKTGRAIPVVDELATIPLNLWASDHGYTKLQTNLLGL